MVRVMLLQEGEDRKIRGRKMAGRDEVPGWNVSIFLPHIFLSFCFGCGRKPSWVHLWLMSGLLVMAACHDGVEVVDFVFQLLRSLMKRMRLPSGDQAGSKLRAPAS